MIKEKDLNKSNNSKQEIRSTPKIEPSPLTKHYGELLSKCISISSASESSDARYAINQLDQELRVMGLRATIKIGIEKIE